MHRRPSVASRTSEGTRRRRQTLARVHEPRRIARGYQVNFLTGAKGNVMFDDGGLPPSPVAGLVSAVVGGSPGRPVLSRLRNPRGDWTGLDVVDRRRQTPDSGAAGAQATLLVPREARHVTIATRRIRRAPVATPPLFFCAIISPSPTAAPGRRVR